LRVEFEPGAMFRVPAGDDEYAYAVMLSKFPYVAFYHRDVTLNDAGTPVDPPMFVILVAKPAYAKGGWGKPIRRLPDGEIPPIPRFSWQDVTNRNNCKIVEPGVRRITASPSECAALEPEAIWSAEHIPSRILDTYAGRPNPIVEALRVKVP
jgi:hypothetical protein